MGEICRLGRVELSKQDITHIIGCNGHSQSSRAGHKSKNGRKASEGAGEEAGLSMVRGTFTRA